MYMYTRILTSGLQNPEVTFPHFEDWWKSRSGIVDVSIPVLPEFMVLRIAEVGGRKERQDVHALASAGSEHGLKTLHERLKPDMIVQRRIRLLDAGKLEVRPENELKRLRGIVDSEIKDALDEADSAALLSLVLEQKGEAGVDYHRTGAELWSYLRPRLKFIVELQKAWGSIHSLYPSRGDSLYEDVPLPKGIRDPDSLSSGLWDLVGLVLLLAVSVLGRTHPPGSWVRAMACCI
jgi:hypothetical protein